MGISLAIKEWQAWLPGIESHEQWMHWAKSPQLPNDAAPASAKAVPAMLRRRLSPLGRGCAQTLLSLEQITNIQQCPLVFSSRHGETSRTVSLLEDLAAQEILSPADFSLSVHNAIAGILSINKKITANITALASQGSELYTALIEATGLLNEGHDQVIVCIYDAPIPEIYRAFPCDFATPYALSLLVENQKSDSSHLLTLSQKTVESSTLSKRDDWKSIDSLNLIMALINQSGHGQINKGDGKISFTVS